MAHHPAAHDHASHGKAGNALSWVAAGLGGVIAAPYVLPYFGIGNIDHTMDLLASCRADQFAGSGLAAAVNSGIQSIPGIGPALAAGGVAATVASAALGIGGMLLGNYVEKRFDKPGHFPWGKTIRYATLASSILIALPSILSSLTIGISFLATLVGGVALASTVFGTLKGTIGMASGINVVSAGAGFSGILPHLLTCGAAILPLGLRGWLMSHTRSTTPPTDTPHEHGLSMKLVSTSPTVMGAPCELAFQLVDGKTGKPVAEHELATMHTKKLHTMVVDASLNDYHHLHPQYDSARKLFTCSFTPASPMPYRAWHDLTPAASGQNVKLMTELPGGRAAPTRPLILQNSTARSGDTHLDISPGTPLRVGGDGQLTLRATDATGAVLTDLEPIMGAYAHLVGFSADGKHMIHCHPLGDEPQAAEAHGHGLLRFHVSPQAAGGTKFFLQIRRNGQDITLPFGQQVLPPAAYTERTAQPHAHHDMAAHAR